MTTATRTGLASALSEDLSTSWAPDVLGLVDAEPLLRSEPPQGSLGVIETLHFPKTDGTHLQAPVLTLPALGHLHRAVAEVSTRLDSTLRPGVCGYRRQAEPGFSYSRENVRLQQMADRAAADASHVVFADVAQFFAHCTWDVVVARSTHRWGSQAEPTQQLIALASRATASGLASLPAGYADARLISNLILAVVDDEIDAPFVRWVDDYRIFVGSRAHAQTVLSALRSSLEALGMRLNESKTRVVDAQEAGRVSGLPLQSVYHPESDPEQRVRGSLRSVFHRAKSEPVNERRALRFVLPRMAAHGDAQAVPWALASLGTIPWEAPRLCAYLAAFAGENGIKSEVSRQLAQALDRADTWTALRIATLTCHTGLSESVAALCAQEASRTHSQSLWSLLLRTLSVNGYEDEVQATLEHRILDARAAAGALADLGRDVTPVAAGLHHATVAALRAGPAPLPDVRSIL